MKLHRSLGYARVAVRRYANAGKGFRETHGLHGNMDKLYYAAVTQGHQALLTGIQKVSEKIRASVRISPIPCPACVCGECHAERYRAPLSDACDMGHSATVRSRYHCPTGSVQMPHRAAVWATSASGSLRAAGFQSQNLMKPYRKVNYGPKCRQGTKERRHDG